MHCATYQSSVLHALCQLGQLLEGRLPAGRCDCCTLVSGEACMTGREASPMRPQSHVMNLHADVGCRICWLIAHQEIVHAHQQHAGS